MDSSSSRWSRAALFAVAAATGRALAQAPATGIVASLPAPAAVEIRVDTFTTSRGVRRRMDVYRPAGITEALPVVLFVTEGGPITRRWRGYTDWARLVTARGFAGVLFEYEGLSNSPSPATPDSTLSASSADLDSVIASLDRRRSALGVDATNVSVWARGTGTAIATPFVLDGRRAAVKSYVLYYGGGNVANPRVDVPVFVARAGLDQPESNRSLDSLARRLVNAGVTVTVVNHAAGRRGFDMIDTTAASARIIAHTLEFLVAASDSSVQRSVEAGAIDARAAAAYSHGRWSEAARLYLELSRNRPNAGSVLQRLGVSQLESGDASGALASLTRARELGMRDTRQVELPAARAAMRLRESAIGAEWILWTLRNTYNDAAVRREIAADPELAALLDDPAVRDGTNMPSGYDRPGMVFDPVRRVIVHFGGGGNRQVSGETWEHDGTRWSRRDIPGPSPRFGHGMVFDSRRNRIVLFGGGPFGTVLGDTWEYDGASWKQVAASGPSPRGAFGIAYDSVRGKTVLFGGSGMGPGPLTDTWEWDGATWTRVATEGASGNSFHRMVYDSRRQRVVSFGGRGGGDDTWEWDGRVWTKVSDSGPSPRDHHALAYHSDQQRTFLFGGPQSVPSGGSTDPDERFARDLWAWDGVMWTQVAAEGPRVPTGLPGFAYDSARRRLVLFGGMLYGNWQWDGQRWTRL